MPREKRLNDDERAQWVARWRTSGMTAVQFGQEDKLAVSTLYASPEERESWSWVRCLRAIKVRLDKLAPAVRPWFVMDRGADNGSTLVELSDVGNVLFTIRARHNLVLEQRYGHSRAFSTLARQPALGTLALHVPRAAKRLERLATFEVRVLRETRIFVNNARALELNYVQIHEVSVVPPERRLGCMMHVRRRFCEALQLGHKRAAPAVGWIKAIYEIEAHARGKPPDERHAIRQEHSIPLLDAFERWVDEQLPKLGKTGKLAEAVRYAQQQRVFVRRCFSDGRFEIDNGACERSIREPAIGRKNFLFTGSVDAAHRLAAAYTLVQTCRNLGLNTREYLTDVLGKIQAGWPARRLTELLPDCWAELHRA